MSEKRLVAIMRNSPGGKTVDLFNILKITKKIGCPYTDHIKYSDLKYDIELNKYVGNNKLYWQGERFLNSININDYVLVYHKGCKEALIVKIKSQPKYGIIDDVKIISKLSKEKCVEHKIEYCNKCKEYVEIVSMDRIEKNISKYRKYLCEDYNFENMKTIYRDIEIVGKIDSETDMYKKYVCLQSSIRILKEKVFL